MSAGKAKKRWLSIGHWRRISRGLGVTTYLLVAWGLFYPNPYLLVAVLLGSAPVVGLALARLSRGALRLFFPTKSRDANVDLYVIIAPAVLGLRALIDFPVVSGWRMLAIGAAAGLLFGLLYVKVHPPSRSRKPATVLPKVIGWSGAAVYGWVIAAMLNGLLPQPAPQQYRLPVLDRFVSGGKNMSYYVVLPPFGSVNEQDSWQIASHLYARTPVGGTVCIDIHAGGLREPWCDVHECKPRVLA